jgi:thiamine kinase-like enzyme
MTAQPLEDRVRRLPLWKHAVSLEVLKGGISNTSFIATDGADRFVVRCGDDIPAHHVSRDRERAVSEAAYQAGLSPELVHGEPGIMVFRYIAGRTYAEADMRANAPRIVALLKRCHADLRRLVRGPVNFFWAFHVIRDNAHKLSGTGGRWAAELPRFTELADRLEAVQMPMPIVFGHHDLLPGNFIDDGKRLWLIDWEYGSYGTALFDLANLAANGSFDEAGEAELLTLYFDSEPSEQLRRSFDAMKAASALREATWALVSNIHLDAPGADYESHAAEFFRRTDAAVQRFEERYGKL